VTGRPSKLGLRIFRRIHRPESADIDRLRDASVCDISDAMRGANTMDAAIRPVFAPMPRICGPAITVDLTPGDGLLLRAAIDVARRGDVIVANGHGECTRAVLGGVIAMHMMHRGIRGLVVDGAVRDVAELRDLGLATMARAVTPRSGTSSSGWGEVNVPIACGGSVVCPGDVIVGDEEGLVVVPRRWVSDVAAALSDTGHTRITGGVRDNLRALPPDAPLPGLERVRRAIEERDGIVIDDTYENQAGPVP